MKKIPIICLAISIFLICPVFAQTSETITFTTYYPSPVGVYNRLVTNTLGVGDNDSSGGIDAADTPDPTTDPGDVWIAGNVGIGTDNPQAALDVSSTDSGLLPPRITSGQRDGISNPPEGSIIYNTTEEEIQLYAGTGWQAVGGVSFGGVYTTSFYCIYGCSTNPFTGDYSCPAGYTSATAFGYSFLLEITYCYKLP